MSNQEKASRQNPAMLEGLYASEPGNAEAEGGGWEEGVLHGLMMTLELDRAELYT